MSTTILYSLGIFRLSKVLLGTKVLLEHGCLKLHCMPNSKTLNSSVWGIQSSKSRTVMMVIIGWYNHSTSPALQERHWNMRNLILPFQKVSHFSVSSSPLPWWLKTLGIHGPYFCLSWAALRVVATFKHHGCLCGSEKRGLELFRAFYIGYFLD